MNYTVKNKVTLHIIRGTDPAKIYSDIETKDKNTLYLLSNGYGYLGDNLLFSGNDLNEQLVSSITGDYADTAKDTDIASAKAVMQYVADKLNDSTLINAHFFRKVEHHIVTQEEVDAATEPTDVFYGFETGTPGLLFTADVDGEDDSNDEIQYFISLKDYIDIYTGDKTNSTTVSVTGGKITCDLNIAESEDDLVVDETGVHLSKVDPETGANEENPGNALVSEKVLVNYVQKAISDMLTQLTPASGTVTEESSEHDS